MKYCRDQDYIQHFNILKTYSCSQSIKMSMNIQREILLMALMGISSEQYLFCSVCSVNFQLQAFQKMSLLVIRSVGTTH